MKPKTIDAAPARRKPIPVVDLSQHPREEFSHCPPPAGVGRGFWARYLAEFDLLDVEVRCSFDFFRGFKDKYDPDPADPKNLPLKTQVQITPGGLTAPEWTGPQKASWKQAFIDKNNNYWSDYFAFACTAPASADLFAETRVRFVDVGADAQGKGIYNVKVYRWPHPEFDNGNVDPTACVQGATVQLAEEAIDKITIMHEAGHMLGLGDEYPKKGKPDEKADHSDLVYDDFRHEVIRGKVDPVRLMNSLPTCKDLVPEYGVVFAFALRSITQMDWKHVT